MMLNQKNITLICLLSLFFTNAAATVELDLPNHSQLIDIDAHKLHINQQGSPDNPKLILLSGPTDNWHSDSAWMLVLHQYLAQNYHSTLIDRAGHGWSEMIKEASYRHFAKDLHLYLEALEEPVILIAFASSNLSVHVLLADPTIHSKVNAVLLIDPDVLTAHALKHYTAESDGFAARFQQLSEYIESGEYDERIKAKIKSEKEHLKTILSEQYKQYMDWDYYRKIETVRSTRNFQIHKFQEVADYRGDIELAQKHPLPHSIPLLVIDTNFEQTYIDNIKDPKQAESLKQWKNDGQESFFQMTRGNKCGAYWAVNRREHLITVSQPDLIKAALKKLQLCNP